MDIDSKIDQILNAKNRPSVVFLAGEERDYILDTKKAIKQICRQKDPSLLNWTEFNDDSNLDEVFSSLKTLPFLSDIRVVCLSLNSIAENTAKKILALDNNNITSGLLLVDCESWDKRKKHLKLLEEKFTVLYFGRSKSFELKEYLKNILNESSIAISEQSYDLIIESCNNEISTLKNIIDKIKLSNKSSLSYLDVQDLIGNSYIFVDVFAFAKLVCLGKTKNAILMLRKAEVCFESPVKILGVLTWQIITILQIANYSRSGMSDNEIQKKINVYSNRYFWMRDLVVKKSEDYFNKKMALLGKADLLLKTSNIKNGYLILEKLILQFL